MPRPWFVAIGGLMGAGKTTLGRNLASTLGWRYLPEAQPAVAFLEDLFSDPTRWAFETQAAFLVNKALQLHGALLAGSGVVLDRTLDEDISIFARYFHDHGHIDDRSYTTYRALAEHFLNYLPAPDALILCQCPVSTAAARISQRRSLNSTLYPAGHLEEIAIRYDDWLSGYRRSMVLALDTSRSDSRLALTLQDIGRELVAALGSAHEQIGLFDRPEAASGSKHLRVHYELRAPSEERPPLPAITHRGTITRHPYAYIAAPFTSHTTPGLSPTLPSIAASHGLLDSGPYRDFLLSIERALRRLGISSVLPHRDVNMWGQRSLTPSEVFAHCLDHVLNADLFVGVLGHSSGAHLEFGLALSRGIPCVLLRVPSITDSFIGAGAYPLPQANVHVISLDSERGVEQALLRPSTSAYLRQYLAI